MSAPHPLAPVREPFRAVVRAAVPATESLDEEGWSAVERVVAGGLSDRPPGVLRQLRTFLRVLELLPVLRHGRRFSRLDRERAAGVLAALERSRLLLLRRGAWGVRTLAFMGWYGQPEVRRRVGYRAAPAGWEALGADAGPWPERGGAGAPEPGVLTTDGPPDA